MTSNRQLPRDNRLLRIDFGVECMRDRAYDHLRSSCGKLPGRSDTVVETFDEQSSVGIEHDL